MKKSKPSTVTSTNLSIEDRRLQRRVRRSQVRKALLRGQTCIAELARQFNVNVNTMSHDVSAIHEQWKLADQRSFASDKQKRIARVNQLFALVELAYLQFEKSCLDAVTITTNTKYVSCRKCAGSGKTSIKSGRKQSKTKCAVCNGKGRIEFVEQTHQVKGQAQGDPSFLTVIKNAYAEIVKLEGLAVLKHEHSGEVHQSIFMQMVERANNPRAVIDDDYIRSFALQRIASQSSNGSNGHTKE